MPHREPARIAARLIRWAIFAALVFVSATLIGVVTVPLDGPALSSSSSAPTPSYTLRGDHQPIRGQRGQDPERRTPIATTPSRPTTRGEAVVLSVAA